MLLSRLHLRHQPEVFEYELDDLSSHSHYGKIRKGYLGGEEAVLFSDDNTADTGFSSQAESATELETEDDGEGEDEDNDAIRARLRCHVNAHYQELWGKYTSLNVSQILDPFQDVHFLEMCMVLELSSERSGLVVIDLTVFHNVCVKIHFESVLINAQSNFLQESAQLLDLVLQLFSRQVRFCDSCIKTLAEDIGRLNRRRKGIRHDHVAPQFESNAGSARKTLVDTEMAADEDSDREDLALYRRKTVCKRNKSHISADDAQLTYDFLKERTSHIFARRVKLHNHCTQAIQNSFLDYQFDFGEYYDVANEFDEDSGRLAHSCTHLLAEMRKHSSRQNMCLLYIPPMFLNEIEPIDDDLDEDVYQIAMDVSNCNESGLGVNDQEGLPNNEENIAPNESTTRGDQQENILDSENTEEEVENVVPKDTENKEKKGSKKKRKRVPFIDKLNFRESIENEAKRARLEEGTETPESLTTSVDQECLRNTGLSNLPSASCNELPHELSINDVIDTPTNVAYSSYDGYNDEWDLTDADGGGSFRPPSPLYSTVDSSGLKCQTQTTRVNMSAIKSKFKDIVQESQRNQQEITFVEILQRSDLEILVGPNETIQPSSFSSFSPSWGEVSVGVAFLAMLHNASSAKLYLLEDHQGAFKVTKEKPQDAVTDDTL